MAGIFPWRAVLSWSHAPAGRTPAPLVERRPQPLDAAGTLAYGRADRPDCDPDRGKRLGVGGGRGRAARPAAPVSGARLSGARSASAAPSRQPALRRLGSARLPL